MAVKEDVSLPTQGICTRCNFVSSQPVCKACVLLEGLNKGLPKLGIGKSSKAKKMLEEYNAKQENALEQAVKDLEDGVSNIDVDSCRSKGRPCRTGLCGSKKENVPVNGETNGDCGTKCSRDCNSKESSSTATEVSNTKLNNILQQYGINDSKSKENGVQTNGDIGSDDETLLDEENTCAGTCGGGGPLHSF